MSFFTVPASREMSVLAKTTAKENGCDPVWSDEYGLWCCGCSDQLHAADQQCSIINNESSQRRRYMKIFRAQENEAKMKRQIAEDAAKIGKPVAPSTTSRVRLVQSIRECALHAGNDLLLKEVLNAAADEIEYLRSRFHELGREA